MLYCGICLNIIITGFKRMNNVECKTILLVEDESIISLVITKTLKRFGYNVLNVTSGEGAVELAGSNEAISLVLMDIDLGSGIDGTEAARQILAIRNVPIVFHTSHSEREMVERVRGITRYGYVIKSSGDFVLQSSIEMAFELVESHRRIVENETRISTLLQSIPDLIWLKDNDGVYISCNKMFTKFFGAEQTEILGRTDYDFVDRDLADFSREHDRLAMMEGKPVINEEWVTFRSDGHKALLETIKTPVIDPEGRIAGVLGIGRDITERKMIEFQRETAVKALRENEARLSMALDVGNAGVWEWNLSDDSVYFDARFNEMLGYKPGDLPVKLQEWLTYHNPDDSQAMMSRAEAYIHGDTPAYESEHRIRSKSGEWNWVFTRGRIVKYSSTGSPELFIGIAMNVTGRKLSEEEIKTKNEELRALNEELTATIEEMEATAEEMETINDDLNDTNRALIEKENELKVSMERLYLIVEQASDGIFLSDRNGKFINVNAMFCEMLGYSAVELLNTDIYRIMPGEMHTDSSSEFEGFHDTKIEIKERQLVRKYGSLLTVEISSKTLPDGSLQGIVRDISARKDAEEQLKRSEELYKMAVAAVDDGIWDWSIPDGKTFFSAQYCKTLGYGDEEFIASYDSWKLLVHPEDMDRVESGIQSSVERGSKFNIDFRMKLKSGEWLWVCIRGKAVEKDTNGKAVRMVGTLSDVSARKHTENELKLSQNKLERIIENSSELICEIDEEGRYTFVSKSYEDILGYTISDLAGKPVSEKMHPDDLMIAKEKFNNLKEETGKSVNEWRFMHKNGNYRNFECRGSAYIGEDGTSRTVVISHDITGTKQVEDVQLFLIASGSPLPGGDFFQGLVSYLAKALDLVYVSVGRFTGGGLNVRTVAGYYDGKPEESGDYNLKDYPCCDTSGEIVCIIKENARSLFPDNIIFQRVGAESYAGAALLSSSGDRIGLITAISREKLKNTNPIESILKMVSIRAAGELERRDAEDKIKNLLSEKETSPEGGSSPY